MSVAEDFPPAKTDEASLKLGDAQHDLPVRKGTLGPDVIDIASLYQDTGCFTYDPGFTSTASCESKITYIDGDQGILLYRGYPIDQLAEHCTFLETAYLLLYGELPKKEQYAVFKQRITRHTMVHEQMNRFYTGFRRDAHPMAIMVGVIGALSAFYHDSIDIRDARQRDMASVRMIAKMPTIAAACYKHSKGEPFIYPQNSLSYPAGPRRRTSMRFVTRFDSIMLAPPRSAARRSTARARIALLTESRSSSTRVASPTRSRYTVTRPTDSGGTIETRSSRPTRTVRTSGPGWSTIS